MVKRHYKSPGVELLTAEDVIVASQQVDDLSEPGELDLKGDYDENKWN